MRVELISAAPGAEAKLRIVMIPGANQAPQDFQSAGFLDAIHERRLPIDIALVELQQAHLTDRSALAQLHTDVVLPARSSGRIAVWLAGISWGGFLALLYATDHPTELDGICLLSPYLGNRMIIAEICRYQSLANWSVATGDTRDELAEDRQVWRYVANHVPHTPAVHYLGFGRKDRFVAAQRLLAARLPPESVDVIDGGHEWPVWRQLWNRFLDRLAAASPELLCSR